MAFKKLKFKVKNPEHSRQIQEALFKLGYRWGSAGQLVIETDKCSISCWDDGYITHTDDMYCHDNCMPEFKESTLEDILPANKSPSGNVISLKTVVEKAGGTWSDTEPVKPPLGLTPRCIVDQARIIDILQAMQRFVEKGMPVAAEWFDELEELLKEGRYVV